MKVRMTTALRAALAATVGVATLAATAPAPASARTARGAAGARVEDHFKEVDSQWTDCPVPPVSVPVECLGVGISALSQWSRVGGDVVRNNDVSIDVFHVHITPDGVTIDEHPFASGDGSAEIVTTTDHHGFVR